MSVMIERMRRRLRWGRMISLLLAAVAGISCGEVSSSHPMGDNAFQLDRQAWEGTWVDTDGEELIVKVLDGAAGELAVYPVEEQAGRQNLEEWRAYARVSGEWVFVSIENESEITSDHKDYLWGRIVKHEDVALVWRPSVEKFRKLVESGVLPGETSVSDVSLGGLTESICCSLRQRNKGFSSTGTTQSYTYERNDSLLSALCEGTTYGAG